MVEGRGRTKKHPGLLFNQVSGEITAGGVPLLEYVGRTDHYERLYQNISAGSQRMAARGRERGIASSLPAFQSMYDVPFISREMERQTPALWVTDQPEKIFGDGPFYTVTSTLAYRSLQARNHLRPPMLHEQFGIETHRGAALPLMTRVFESLQMFVEKDYVVWTGAKIDPEQVVLEHQIAGNSTERQQQLIGTLFDRRDNGGVTKYRVKLELRKIMERIYTGQNVSGDLGLEEYIAQFENAFTASTATRDGWLTIIDAVLRGERDRTDELGLTRAHIESYMLGFYMNSISTIPVEPSEVAILEIDPKVIYQQVGKGVLFPLMPRRTPDEFFPAPFIPLEAVKAVYTLHCTQADQEQDPRMRDISEIPTEKFLTGRRPEEITEVDMFHPTCIVRYQGKSPQQIWWEHATAGRMVPLSPIEFSLTADEGARDLLSYFGKNLLSAKHLSEQEQINHFVFDHGKQPLPGVFAR